MAITRRVSGVLATAAAVAAVVGLSATPAMASTTLTAKVSGGGSITAVASKTVLSNGSGAKKVSVTCTTKKKTDASKATGSISNGTHKGAEPLVGKTTKLSFGNCTGPVGAVKTKVEALSYKISVDSKTTKKGDTDGIIGPVKVHVSMTGCSFNVTGTAPGFYDNANHTLHVTPFLPTKALKKAQLTISGVSGCFGLVSNGNHPSYVSTYTVSRKVVIKVS
jgi:hypothetical protein